MGWRVRGSLAGFPARVVVGVISRAPIRCVPLLAGHDHGIREPGCSPGPSRPTHRYTRPLTLAALTALMIQA